MSFCLVIIIQINLYQCPLNIFTLLNNTFTRSSTVRTLLNYSYKLQVSLIIQKKKKCNIRHLLHLVDQNTVHYPLFHVVLGSHKNDYFKPQISDELMKHIFIKLYKNETHACIFQTFQSQVSSSPYFSAMVQR